MGQHHNDSDNLLKELTKTVTSGIEVRLLFNFWTFGAVLYLFGFFQFLFNKNANFHEFFSLLFKTIYYSIVYGILNLKMCYQL